MSNRWFGTQQSRWPVVPIRKVCRLGTGHTPDRNNADYWREDECVIPWVTVADIHRLPGLGLVPLQDTEQHISQVGLDHSAAVLHPTGTVMVSRTASIGFACRIARPMATTQAFITWTPGPRVDSRYLLLIAKALYPEFERLAYGSTHLTIYMPDIENISMPLPALSIQSAIADYLDRETERLDTLIAARRRMAYLLQERFESYVYLACIGNESEQQHRFSPSGIYGSVPKSWAETSLRHLGCEVQTGPFGSQLHAEEYVEDGWPVVNPMNLVAGRIVATPGMTITTEKRAELSRHMLVDGDIVFGRRGEMGRAGLVGPDQVGWLCGTGSLRMRLRTDALVPGYLQLLLQTPPAKAYFSLSSVGSTMENLNSEVVLSFPTLVPSKTEQMAIVEKVHQASGATERLLGVLREQVGLLQERRAALITAAVTGELDIPESA